MVLVDTSVLIDYLRGAENAAVGRFQQVLDANLAFGISPLTYLEVLQGTRTEKDYATVKSYLETHRFYGLLDEKDSYAAAARIYFDCRKKGITVNSTVEARGARGLPRPRRGHDLPGQRPEVEQRLPRALQAAREAARQTSSAPVPLHLRNAPTGLMQALGYGAAYQYPHDLAEGFSPQRYLPPEVGAAAFYQPGSRGFEKKVAERLAWWEALRAGGTGSGPAGAPPGAP